MGDQTKKELKDLGKKYDEMKANLEKKIDDLQEDIKNSVEKTLRDDLKQDLQLSKKALEELKIKIEEEINYIKSGMIFKEGKWIKPEEKKTPEEVKLKEEPEPAEKDSGWFL